MTATTALRVCACCGAADGHGTTFTGTVRAGQRRARYSRYCDACRGSRRGGQTHGDNGPDDFPVSAADAARYLALAAEYAALWARAEDTVERHRLARAVKDYRAFAARVKG